MNTRVRRESRWCWKPMAVLLLFLALAGCGLFDSGGSGGGGSSGPGFEPVAGWSASRYSEIAFIQGSGSVTIPAERAGELVYYVVTNYGEEARTVTVSGAGLAPSLAPAEAFSASGSGEDAGRIVPSDSNGDSDGAGGGAGAGDIPAAQDRSRGLRGHPSITAENEELARRLAGGGTGGSALGSSTVRASSGYTAPEYTVEGTPSKENFYYYYWFDKDTLKRYGAHLTATLREMRVRDGWRLLVWEDDAYSGDDNSAFSNLELQALADDFLDGEGSGDILQWVSAAFGASWGAHAFSNIIHPEVRDIHILLHDLDNDHEGAGDGVVVGLFSSLDNFTNEGNEDVSTSNELLMFYINATLVKDYRDDVISTLAHEFQHMIQFYQRVVRRGNGGFYPTWLNELASMAAEDLVADKLEIEGPRAVAHTIGGAGTAANYSGRMPWYNAYGALRELTTWSQSDALPYYGISYSFGAFLTRVYGARVMEVLLKEIPVVSGSGTGVDITYDRWATAEAVRQVEDSNRSFADLLRRWGIAVIVSDDTGAPGAVRLNRGDWFTSGAASQTFSLGSIDAYNYSFNYNGGTYHGPSLWSPGTASVPAAANRFVVAGKVPTGGATVSFSLPGEVIVTVLTER